jgi:hypothetical protein
VIAENDESTDPQGVGLPRGFQMESGSHIRQEFEVRQEILAETSPPRSPHAVARRRPADLRTDCLTTTSSSQSDRTGRQGLLCYRLCYQSECVDRLIFFGGGPAKCDDQSRAQSVRKPALNAKLTALRLPSQGDTFVDTQRALRKQTVDDLAVGDWRRTWQAREIGAVRIETEGVID